MGILFIPYSRIIFVRVTGFKGNVFFDIHTQGTEKILRIEGVQKWICKHWT